MLGRSHTGRGGQFVQQGLSVKAKKTHHMLIGWRIVNVFPILFGKCRPAFVDHSRQDHEPAQPDAKAPRRTFSQVDEKSLSFHFATRRSFRHSVGSSGGQFSRTPPSMINSVPVMLLESSDSRNLAARATSSDVPHRFKSDFATIVSSNPFSWSAGRPVFFIIGVSIGPGIN